MSRQLPVTVSSESDSPIAVTITSASESAQTISSDLNPHVVLVSEIITVAEEDDQRFDTIQHVDSSSADKGQEVLEAEVAIARARREKQEALERLAHAPGIRTVRFSHSVRSALSSEPLQISANGESDMKENIVYPTRNIVYSHVRYLPKPRRPRLHRRSRLSRRPRLHRRPRRPCRSRRAWMCSH